MKKLIYILIILFFSCKPDTSTEVFLLLQQSKIEKLIYYEYNDVVITRREVGNKAYFYYGKHEANFPETYICGIVQGRDGCFEGHLVFKKDKSVDFIPGGYIIEEGNDTMFCLIEESESGDLSRRREWYDRIKGNFDSVYRINYAFDAEKRYNGDNHSKVVVYQILDGVIVRK